MMDFLKHARLNRLYVVNKDNQKTHLYLCVKRKRWQIFFWRWMIYEPQIEPQGKMNLVWTKMLQSGWSFTFDQACRKADEFLAHAKFKVGNIEYPF